MRKGLALGAVVVFVSAIALSAVPATASPGDYDGDGILDRYDARPKGAFRRPLGHLSTSDLMLDLDGVRARLPAVAYVEAFGATSMTIVSAEIRGNNVFNKRVYSGPVFITKARIRNLKTLNLDADILIGASLNTYANASAQTGGAVVRGQGLCLSIKKVHQVVDKLEAASGQEVTLFNLAEVADKAKDALGNIKLGVCGFVLAVKNGGSFREILNQGSPLFPGVGRADRMTAAVWGAANWKTSGFRLPLRFRIPGLVSFVNGRLSADAL